MQTTLSATLQAVSRFSQQLETDHLGGLSIDVRTTLVLAMQELLVNIVQHAYDGTTGTINFEMAHDNQRIVIRVHDDAPKGFNLPETIQEPDPLDLPEHGLGLFIIYQTFDTVHYNHSDDGNRWQLTKTIGETNG